MARLVWALLPMLWTLQAKAQATTRPALHWSRGADAAECIDPRSLALRVTALTGAVLVEPTAATLSIEGHVARVAGGFEVRVTATEGGAPRGERTLRQDGSDCRGLDEAVAFVIATLIDPDLALEKLPASLITLGAEERVPAEQRLLSELVLQPPAAHVGQGEVTRAVPLQPEPPAPVASAAREEPAFWAVGGGLAGSGRELARLALGLTASIAARPWPWLSFELQMRPMVMAGHAQLDPVRSLSAQLLAFTALTCPRWPASGRAAIEGCVGPELDWTRVRGHGFRNEQTAKLWSYATHVALGFVVEVAPRLALRTRAFLRASPKPPSFQYEVLESVVQKAFSTQRFAPGMLITCSYAL